MKKLRNKEDYHKFIIDEFDGDWVKEIDVSLYDRIVEVFGEPKEYPCLVKTVKREYEEECETGGGDREIVFTYSEEIKEILTKLLRNI